MPSGGEGSNLGELGWLAGGGGSLGPPNVAGLSIIQHKS